MIDSRHQKLYVYLLAMIANGKYGFKNPTDAFESLLEAAPALCMLYTFIACCVYLLNAVYIYCKTTDKNHDLYIMTSLALRRVCSLEYWL